MAKSKHTSSVSSTVYDVYTDADRDEIEAVALEIFKEWVAFAEGRDTLGGKYLLHPTGLYASSLRLEIDRQHVAIIADESIAPEALFLEVGHGSIDLKKYASPTPQHIHMQRGGGVVARVSQQRQPRFPRASPPGRLSPKNPSLYATRRSQFGMLHGSEWATLSKNSPPGSWIIPPMPAYQPGKWLADAAKKRLG